MGTKQTLKESLEIMLEIATKRLERAIDKKDKWHIKHYREDVDFIKSELEIVNKQEQELNQAKGSKL
jgi:hypothetical protein